MVVKNEMYKGFNFLINKDLNYLELLIEKQELGKIENCILPISIMVEYAIYIRPNYVVINNKSNTDLKVTNKIIVFIKQIFHQLRLNGIKKIIILANADEYMGNIEIEPFIIIFNNIIDFEQWLIENKKKEFTLTKKNLISEFMNFSHDKGVINSR